MDTTKIRGLEGETMKIFMVCKGNPEYHENLMPFRKFEDAENYAKQQAHSSQRAYGNFWERLNDFKDPVVAMCLNDRTLNVAVWYDKGDVSYISIEEWEIK